MSDDVQKWCALGEQHLLQGKPEEALHWYRRAIDVDPENASAWCGRARSHYHLGHLDRADRAYGRALRLAKSQLKERPPTKRPRRWWVDESTRPYLLALKGRGECRYWLGEYGAAADAFERLLRLDPSDPLDVRYLFGEASFREGHIDAAIGAWQGMGDDPDALYNLGLGYFYRGEFTRSVHAFRRGIFENLFLVARLTQAEIFSDVPRYRGTHTKGLDCEHAAADYLQRCGDLWRGRPLLSRWLRAVYEHTMVQADIRQHIDQLRALVRSELAPGERAQLEGANTALRSDERLARTDAEIARELCERLFRVT